MSSWLEDNPLGIALASVCGGLLVIALLLSVIWALPASSPTAGADSENAVPGLVLPELAASQTIDKYAVITDHPVFNSTRLPVLEPDLDDTLDKSIRFVERRQNLVAGHGEDDELSPIAVRVDH